ncbi:hypothetical protein [Labrys neptuniae]
MLRPLRTGLLLACLLVPATAVAQTAAPITEQGCRDLLAQLSKSYWRPLTAAKASTKGNGGCLYGDVRAEAEPKQVSIDTIDVDRIVPDPQGADRLPQALRLSVMGLRVTGGSGDAAMDTMAKLSNEPFAFSIDYERDPAAKTLKLSALTFNTAHGALSLSGEIARLEPSPPNGPSREIVTRTALKSLEFSLLDEQGEVQRLLLLPLGYTLVRGSSDPAARLKQMQDQAAAWLRLTLSLINMPPAEIDSAIAALTDFPKATKALHLAIKLPEPVGVDDIFRVMIGGTTPQALFPDGWIELSYGK